MARKAFDLTEKRPKLNRFAFETCRDACGACASRDHVGCWLSAPHLGICPFIKTKEKNDGEN